MSVQKLQKTWHFSWLGFIDYTDGLHYFIFLPLKGALIIDLSCLRLCGESLCEMAVSLSE